MRYKEINIQLLTKLSSYKELKILKYKESISKKLTKRIWHSKCNYYAEYSPSVLNSIHNVYDYRFKTSLKYILLIWLSKEAQQDTNHYICHKLSQQINCVMFQTLKSTTCLPFFEVHHSSKVCRIIVLYLLMHIFLSDSMSLTIRVLIVNSSYTNSSLANERFPPFTTDKQK